MCVRLLLATGDVVMGQASAAVTYPGMKRHAAGALTYPGKCLHIVGEVKGPLTYGYTAYVVAVSAVYLAQTDSTRVEFDHIPPADLPNIVRDKFGIMRLPSVEATT